MISCTTAQILIVTQAPLQRKILSIRGPSHHPAHMLYVSSARLIGMWLNLVLDSVMQPTGAPSSIAPKRQNQIYQRSRSQPDQTSEQASELVSQN